MSVSIPSCQFIVPFHGKRQKGGTSWRLLPPMPHGQALDGMALHHVSLCPSHRILIYILYMHPHHRALTCTPRCLDTNRTSDGGVPPGPRSLKDADCVM